MPSLNDLMEMMDALETKAVVTMPTRCVAVRNRNAKCRRCVEVCFADAITIDKNELTIDAGACVACGSCIAVCPTQALIPTDPMEEELAHSVAQTVPLAEGAAVIACARMAARQTGDPDKYSVVPCLGRMEEQLMVELAARDVSDIVLVDGTCATCKYRAAVPAIDDTVESARTLLESVGSQAVITRTSSWPAAVQVEDLRKAVGAARRDFFTQSGHYAKDVAKSAAEKMVSDKLKQLKLQKEEASLREKLGVKSGAGKMPTIAADRNMAILDGLARIGEPVEEEMFTRIFGDVIIDTELCSGCNMCVMFCPTDALRKGYDTHPDEDMQYLEFSVADCTQCNLCVDACLKKCMEVAPVVSTAELFDFEPRLIEIPKPKKGNKLFNRNR
ncbi:4Fe-4S binding protein [uncultured Adlercreutzia sp.]|uniref:4Fe-4S binding protein n=1 Tax=uncultured Adlercreutzia sp. TaxID=875803 RepID=UPI0025E89644|nr:4Fe-4S binding protein [uncultured Adlercreutzia sp.]MCI9262702.1 4Fe-4S binding protein [Eggerthellaceae bacterium]